MAELETPRVVAAEQTDPEGLALVDGRLAWSALGPPPPPGRRDARVLRSVRLDGNDPRDLVNDVRTQGLVGDALGFVWRDQAVEGETPTGAQLQGAPPGGGPMRRLVVGRRQLHALGATPDLLVWLEGTPLQAALLRARRPRGSEPAGEPEPVVPQLELTTSAGLVLRDGRAWWTGQSALESVGLDGSDRRRLASARGGPLALDDEFVYLLGPERDRPLQRVPRAGGPVERLAAAEDAVHLGVDATHLYWTTRAGKAGGALRRVPKTGGPVELLARGAHSFGPLLVEGGSVYWVDEGRGAKELLLTAIFGGPAAPAVAGAVLALPTSTAGAPVG